MEDIRPFNDISRNSTTMPMVSPIPFEAASDQYYFSPISNQMQGTSSEVYWQYSDHRRSPYPNGFNNVGQYPYWRHSPYPTGDQMLMREWSTSSPDHCNYQIPPWSMEAVSMVQGMNMHHGISQWSSGNARTSLDFSGSGDTSMSDLVIPPEFSRDEHMLLEQENRSSSHSFSASPWQQSSNAPLMTELLVGEPKYSSCRWPADGIPNLGDSEPKDLENKCKKTEEKTQELLVACKEKMDEKDAEFNEAQDDSTMDKDQSLPEQTPQKRNTKPSRKPEAYDRQKKVQRQREGLIRNAIQALNLILPDDNKGKKLSKNLVLLKAIDYIKKLKEQLGDAPIEGLEMIDEIYSTEESPHRKPKKRKRTSTSKLTKMKVKEGSATPEKISSKLFKVTSPQLLPSLSSPSPPRLTHSPLPPKATPPPKPPTNHLSPAATNDYQGAAKQSLLRLLQDPAILTPSDTSSGSERAESPTTDDDVLHNGENTNHVKRPMNAFLLFSKSNRENFKRLYPGKDNRRISTILGEHWNTMKSEEKQPFQEMARELMRKTKETYPDFKYSPTDQSSKFKAFKFISKDDSPKKGVRVGNHRLRSRYGKERNSDSSVSSDGNWSCKESDVLDNTITTLSNKHLSKTEPKNDKQQPTNQLPEQNHQGKEKEKANKDYTRYSRCDNWVQCDKCRKWRMLDDDVNLDELPDQWFCWMSPDPRVNNCQVPEAVRWTDMRKRGILKDGE